jgi:LysM repeat protein
VPEDSVDGVGERPDAVAPRGRTNRTVTPAIAGALVVLAASFALSVAFVVANGGLSLPAAQRPVSTGAVTGAVPSAVASGSAEASVAPTESEATLASPAPSSKATPAPSATARPTPETPGPSSNRYDLLTACPSTPDCWVYVVRQGDNLVSIARYFGVPLKVVEQRNPWTTTSQLVAGQKLLLPAPTR